MPIDKDAVVRLFSDKASRPLTLPELEAHLSLSEEDKPDLAPAIDELVQAGQIVALRGQRYGVAQRTNLLTGILQAHPNGFAFLVPDKPGERAADVFIGRNDLADAMHGDKVVVRVERTGRMGKPEGRVTRILERRVHRVVGEYQVGDGHGWVVPEEGRHLHHIYIPRGRDKRALAGQIVVVEIVKYPAGNRDPEGVIARVLGNRTDPDVDHEVIVERYGLSSRFPNEVLTEAKLVPSRVDTAEIGLRVDLRGLKTITIDGENAKDFDDAVAVARSPDGRFRLWVSIADVAHYVKDGTPLDREARARATSVYFPDRVIPMLPEELSNGICSLNPHVERLAMTAELQFDSEGKVLSRQFYDSVIVSKERLTYTEVNKMLTERDESLLGRYRYLEDDLRNMEELALKLKSRRDERGSLDFDLPQPDVLLDMEGNIESIVRAERNIAHRMVEEFMLAANEAVAGHLTHEGVPVLYRCHDEPEAAKIEDLRYFLHNLNLKLDHKVTPKALQRLLRQVRGRPLEKLVNEVTLRTMKHAYYSPRNNGHFGLASENYLHFTSPIRRYPDLVVHRILKSVIERGGMSESQRQALSRSLGDTAAHCSELERNAERAERESLALKKVQFMQQHLGEEFDGYISGVTSFGFFVELIDLFVDGLVHVSSLGDDYYEFRERSHQLIGQNSGRTFQLADKVRVKVARIDSDKRHIDFALTSDASRLELPVEEQPAKKGRPVPQVALEPVHPESGDGRGRQRKAAPPAYTRGLPQRAPRPAESPDDDDRRRRGARPKRDREDVRRRVTSIEATPEPVEAEPVVAVAPDESGPVIEAEVSEGGATEQKKRRRRGGRGRKRRGATELAADNLQEAAQGVTEQAASEDAGAESGRDDAEPAPESAADAQPGVEGEPAPRPARGRRPKKELPVTEAAPQDAPAEGEAAEPVAPEEGRRRVRREAAPEIPEAEATAAEGGSSEPEAPSDDEGAEQAGEAGLAFVNKRRRRRRGGRTRRRPPGAADAEAGAEPGGDEMDAPAPEAPPSEGADQS